jgi:hypothetical protein
MAYRDDESRHPCGFCQTIAEMRCARCGRHLCYLHRHHAETRCGACEAEYQALYPMSDPRPLVMTTMSPRFFQLTNAPLQVITQGGEARTSLIAGIVGAILPLIVLPILGYPELILLVVPMMSLSLALLASLIYRLLEHWPIRNKIKTPERRQQFLNENPTDLEKRFLESARPEQTSGVPAE